MNVFDAAKEIRRSPALPGALLLPPRKKIAFLGTDAIVVKDTTIFYLQLLIYI